MTIKFSGKNIKLLLFIIIIIIYIKSTHQKQMNNVILNQRIEVKRIT